MYKVVQSSSTELSEAIEWLEKLVNSLSQDGWVPQGGISVLKDGIWCQAFQAMVKKDD